MHKKMNRWRSARSNGVNHNLFRTIPGTAFLIFCLVFFSAAPAGAQDSRSSTGRIIPIQYGYPSQSIFVATIDDEGQPESPMKRVAEALMEKAGIPVYSKSYPARRLFKNLREGTTDFSILVRASSLLDHCIFSKKPVYSTTLNVYFIGDKPPVKSKEDLVGKKVITIRGYSYAGLLKFIMDPANKIVNEVAGTHRGAFKMLENKRADYLLDYASAAGDILAERPVEHINSSPVSSLDIFLVLSRAYPDAADLMVKLEDIADTMNVDQIIKGK